MQTNRAEVSGGAEAEVFLTYELLVVIELITFK